MGEVLVALLLGWFFGGGRGPIGPGPDRPKPAPGPPVAPPVKPPPGPAPAPPPKAPEGPLPGGVTPAPVPPSYRPTGGWSPHITPWSVGRSQYYLGLPSKLPTGSSITETGPDGIQTMFRAESGAAHGDPKLKRAVTAWKRVG